jgi:hypothetical protein
MAMTREEAIQKALKLMALAGSDNVHEAAAAAARAQEILRRYEIDATILSTATAEPEEDIEDFMKKGAPLDGDRYAKAVNWKCTLANVISKSHQCKTFTSGGAINIVGQPSLVETVRYVYALLVGEIEKLTDKNGKGCGRTWRNNYRYGAVAAIREKFEEANVKVAAEVRAEYVNNPLGLVKVENALAKISAREAAVQAFVKKAYKLHSRSSSRTVDYAAYEQGKRDGKNINVNSARGALGNSVGKLNA